MDTAIARNIASLPLFGPELVLIVTLCAVVVADLIGKRRGGRGRSSLPITLVGLVVALAVSLLYAFEGTRSPSLFHGMLALDPFAIFFKVIFCATGLFLVLMSLGSRQLDPSSRSEYHTVLLSITLGLFLMASATDLLMVYLALEFVSILSYIAAGLQPREARSREAALKYVIFGGAASAVMLYGMSLVYGMAGSTNLLAIRDALAAGPHDFTLLFALAMILGGLGYKIAAVPFHMWAPDVYEGSPTPVTAFFSVAPKAAGFAVLIRLFATWFSGVGDLGSFGEALANLIALMAVATMIVGNFGALLQTNIKRFLAYSSIAHAGYLLMGIALLPYLSTEAEAAAGVRAVLLYLIFYVFMNLGAFWVASLVIDSTGSEEVSAFRGFGQRNKMAAVAMAVFLFSLAGLPPLAGFVGKFFLFAAVIEKGGVVNTLMVVVAALTSVVAVFYYFRICRAMFIDRSARTEPQPIPRLASVMLGICVVPTVLFGLFWNPLIAVVDEGMAMAGVSMAADPDPVAEAPPEDPASSETRADLVATPGALGSD